MSTKEPSPSAKTLRGLDWLNLFLADVQTGVGPFFAIYLASLNWNAQNIGLALTVAGVAGIATQTPAGGLVDHMHAKRALIAAGIAVLGLGSIVIAFWPRFWTMMAAQACIGGVSSIFIPAVCAVSLGLVGQKAFDERQGRNQTFNSAGNVAAALAIGLTAFFISNRATFLLVAALTIPTFIALRTISSDEIDYQLACGGAESEGQASKAGVMQLLRDRPLVIFLICAVLFHFANAAMLPLLGEMLAEGQGRSSMIFMSACIITTQLIITFLAAWSGRKAGSWGRKPLLLIAFGVLPIRGILYSLTGDPALLIAIQILDGIAAGIFGVVSVLAIADLTRGTGRFNLTLGAITTAVGLGASLSQFTAGVIVHHLGYDAGFLFLAVIAATALALFWQAMPETRNIEVTSN